LVQKDLRSNNAVTKDDIINHPCRSLHIC
jgi:hypothetical protein